MKVLHVVPSVGPLRGGPSFTARAMAAGLAEAGVEVHLVTTDDNGPARLPVPLGRPVDSGGVTYWYFPRQTRFYTASWPLTRWLDRSIDAFDLAHIHGLFTYTPIAGALSARRHAVPYILRPIGTLSGAGFRRRPLLKQLSLALFERRVLARAAAVQYATEHERDEAAALGLGGRAVVVPNPVPFAVSGPELPTGHFRALFPWLAGRTVALFLGRLDPIKGLELLLPAFAHARAQRPELALVIAGAGPAPYEARLRATAERLGIAGDLCWAGFLEGERKRAALADADLFMLPSHSENFGVAVAEAMGAGLPVIVSDRVGLQREVAGSGGGLVVPGAVAPLAGALVALAEDPQMRRAMGLRAQRFIAGFCAPPVVAGRLIELYAAVAAGRSLQESTA